MSRLLLLHGFLGRGADWAAVREHLPSRFDVQAPDLPGHGTAVGLVDAAYTMDGAAARLAALLRGEPADVVGYSMGGRLALHFALCHPSLVRRLVLVSASPGLRTDAERSARRALDAERAAALADPAAFLRDWYRMPLFAALPDALRQRLVADRLRHADPAELARSLRGMGTGAQPSHWSALGGIPMPAWAVAGARDPKFVRLAEAMAAAGPVTPVVVPDAGHLLPAERPAALAAFLTDTLSD